MDVTGWGKWMKMRFPEIKDEGLKDIIRACKLELARRDRVRRKSARKVSYSQQRRGKGLYWYAYWTDPQTGKKRSKYIGKEFREIQIENNR